MLYLCLLASGLQLLMGSTGCLRSTLERKGWLHGCTPTSVKFHMLVSTNCHQSEKAYSYYRPLNPVRSSSKSWILPKLPVDFCIHSWGFCISPKDVTKTIVLKHLLFSVEYGGHSMYLGIKQLTVPFLLVFRKNIN